jgi:hypothetical protein
MAEAVRFLSNHDRRAFVSQKYRQSGVERAFDRYSLFHV